ncbi:MAG: hypothetical protein H7039_14455 [Bryobacteraceae bacterium]|nr:hypothetical protein [Bryobacteraceae bacterium]
MLVLLLPLLSWGQITKPPEFQDKGTFQRGGASATLDGSSHVSAQRTVINQELLERLRALPGHAEGASLLANGMLGPAADHFEENGLRIGTAVTHFLAGRTGKSAELLCTLAKEQPENKTLLPFLGETVGEPRAWAAPMLAAMRKLASPPTAEGEYYLAQALLKQDPSQAAEAMEHLTRSTALNPKETRALLEVARQESSANRKPQAIAALEEALRRDERLAIAHYRLGLLYRATGETERGSKHLRRYEELR